MNLAAFLTSFGILPLSVPVASNVPIDLPPVVTLHFVQSKCTNFNEQSSLAIRSAQQVLGKHSIAMIQRKRRNAGKSKRCIIALTIVSFAFPVTYQQSYFNDI